ncbi:MAG: ATP-binding protein [Cytophagales bacterium]|nr:ATP-binding protein [Cytophagales bacterium]
MLIIFLIGTRPASAQLMQEEGTVPNAYHKLRYTSFAAAQNVATKSLLFARQQSDSLSLLKSYIDFIDFLYLTRENQAARDTLARCLPIAAQVGDPSLLAQLYNYQGGLEMRASNYNKALQHFEAALIQVEASDNYEVIGLIKNNLVRLYLNLDDRNHAVAMVEENLKGALLYQDTLTIANAYNIKGILFGTRNFDSALVSYEKALLLTEKSKNEYLESIVTSNIGYLYLIKDLPNRSFPYLLQSKKLSEQIGDNASLFHIYTSLGIYYDYKDNYKKSIEQFRIALDEYGQYVDIGQINETLWEISGVYEHVGYFEEANEALNLYIAQYDSIASTDKKKEFEKIRTEFDVKSKDDQILILEQENELETSRRNVLITSVAGLVILLIVSGFFYRHRLKSEKIIQQHNAKVFEMEKNQLIQDQELKKIQGIIEGKEKEQNRISQELHDGIIGKLIGVRHLLEGSMDASDSAVSKVYNHLTDVSAELRGISHQLSVHHIRNQPFTALLDELREQYEIPQLAMEISVFPERALDAIHFEQKHALYRILQEAFNNIEKHANASEVSVAFTRHESYLSIMIEDDGVGFKVEKSESGIGLANIQERVRTMSGSITINSSPGKGTIIEVELPMN